MAKKAVSYLNWSVGKAKNDKIEYKNYHGVADLSSTHRAYKDQNNLKRVSSNCCFKHQRKFKLLSASVLAWGHAAAPLASTAFAITAV